MDMATVSKFVQLFLEATVAAAAPIIAHVLISYIRARGRAIWLSVDAEKRYVIEEVVRMAVTAAEQSGLANEAMQAGEAKKDYALALAEKALAQHGITLDLGLLDAMIEAAVWQEINRKAKS